MPLPQPAPPPQIAPAPLAAPDWLAGSWRGGGSGAAYEEHWSRGGSGLLGLFRMERGEASVFLEAMVIEREGNDTVLRIRHFGPGLKTAWEEKDRPVVFRLAHADGREVRFEGTGPWTGETLHYRRTDPDGLEVVLEKKGPDGRPRRSAFTFHRAR